MTNSPFINMAATLTREAQPVSPPPARRPNIHTRYSGATRAMRHSLDQGSYTAAELAEIHNLHTTALVGALLAFDIRKGRVKFDDGVYRRVRS